MYIPNWLLIHLHRLRKKGVKLSPHNEKVLNANAKRLLRLLDIMQWNWAMRTDMEEKLEEARLVHEQSLTIAWEESTLHLERCSYCQDRDMRRCDNPGGCNFVASLNKQTYEAAIEDYHCKAIAIDDVYYQTIAATRRTYNSSRM